MNDLSVSFEFFPPKTEDMEKILWESIERLGPLDPRFLSVTYGAGGSTRARTHEIVRRIIDDTGFRPAAHLTCAGSSKDDIKKIVTQYWEGGVRHIVALRGDPCGGPGTEFVPHPDGYERTSDLVKAIKEIAPFEVCVGAYPEKHPEAASLDADIDALQAKVDEGADCAITQFFFENDTFFDYVNKVRARGITIPIIPGILPVQNFKQTAKFAAACNTCVPQRLAERFEGLENDPQTRALVATTICAEQVADLHNRGVKHFHFYTMNRANLVFAICHLLGVRPQLLAEAAE